MILTETPRRQQVTKLVNWGHRFTFFNILIALVIASIYVFNTRMPDTVLGGLYLLVNWLGHISFLTFSGFVILILPLCYLVPNVKVVKGVASVIAAVSLALLAFDALLYNKYGVHVSFKSADLLRYETNNVIANFSWQQWAFLGLLFVVWLGFQLIMANALWKRIERFRMKKYGRPVAIVLTSCFVCSHATHIWADANLYQPIVQQDDMFPLSYPATAKALMAKYGLMDYASYEQRKKLQLDRRVTTVNYPASPMYCSVNAADNVNLLLINDGSPEQLAKQYGLQGIDNHYDLSTNTSDGLFSVLFGLPQMYRPAVAKIEPVLLDLPAKLGMETLIFAPHSRFNNSNWSSFSKHFDKPNAKLAIGVVTLKQAAQLLKHLDISKGKLILTRLDPDHEVGFYSNIAQLHPDVVSSHLDIAPTLLHLLGCQVDANAYSTGQNLLAPTRQWLVTTQHNKVVLLNNAVRVEVDSGGNYKIFDRLSHEQLSSQLDTSLLSQGVKHVSRFVAN